MKKTLAMLGAASAIAIAAASAASAGTITGRVTDASQTVGLQGAVVRVVETGQFVTVGRDGSFRIAGLAAGEYTLRVSYIGADDREISVRLATAESNANTAITLGDDVDVVENILVIGQRGSLNTALSRQRSADEIQTILSADAIGQFPDENVAEAARRAVGVNVLNDQGEGRFVSIRGIDPNLVSTSINGVRLTSPEAEDRQVGLDVIDADVLQNIVINKGLTADMDGDSIGGNVEIETISGLDADEMMLRGRIGGVYSNQGRDTGYRLSGVFVDSFLEDRLGVALSVSHQNRPFGSENIEVDGEWDSEDGGTADVFFPNELELRDYIVERERTTVTANFDFAMTNEDTFFFRNTWSDFSDDERRSRVENKFEDGTFLDGGVSFDRTAVFQADDYEVDRDIKNRLENQTIFATEIGGEHFRGDTSYDWTVSFVSSEEAEPNRMDTDFRAGFDGGEIFGVNADDPMMPQLRFGSEADRQAYYDPSNYEFDGLEHTNGLSLDREYATRFNIRHDMSIFGAPGYVQGGVAARFRRKNFNVDVDVYDGFDGPDLTLADFAFSVDYELEDIGTTADAEAIEDFFYANQADFELNAIDTAENSLAADYRSEEDVLAAYGMFSADFGATRVTAGLRIEQTDSSSTGNRLLLQEWEITLPGDRTGGNFRGSIPAPASSGGELVAEIIETDFDGAETEIEGAQMYRFDVSAANDYTDVLPSVHVRHEFREDLIGRAGFYQSIQRPNPNESAPRVFLEQNEDGDVEGEFGNPDLDRQEARNFDAALEWYPNNDSLISVGVFWKEIDGFIAQIQEDDVAAFGTTLDEATTFINLDTAELTGVELAYYQDLDWLLPFDGVLAGANFTYIDSEATLADGRQIELPRVSETVTNLILGYDRGPWDLRAVWTHRDEFLDEIRGGADEDRIVLDHTQLDLSGRYRFNDRISAYLEVKNVTDEPFEAATRPDGIDRLEQFEEYGWSSTFGFRLSY